VALRPAEVHPDEHLRPVRGLGAADARDHVQGRAVLVVLAGEQERGALALEITAQGLGFAIELCRQVRVLAFREEVEERGEIVGAALELAPRADLGAQAVSLPKDLLGGALVVPEAGLEGLPVERGEALFPGG
jgi:hypothetical protein